MRNIAVILAGGCGARFGEELPKQFAKVAGKKIIEHTIDAFEQNGHIDEIAIVSHKDYIHLITEICITNQYKKVKKILQGGKQRYESSVAAIRAYTDNTNLIFHDAVRPLVSQRIINDCIEALKKYNAVDVAVKASDTIVQAKEQLIQAVPDREYLYNGQTPQGFSHSVIKRAYERALMDPAFKTTDDCNVVKAYLPDEPIYVVEGEQTNIKLTYREDLFLIDKLFQLKTINSKYYQEIPDVDYTHKVIVIFGGTSGIGQCIETILKSKNANVYSCSRKTGIDIKDGICIKNYLSHIYAESGRIDAVINSAAVLQKQTLLSMSDAEITDGINTNYVGSINVAKAAYPYLMETHGALLLFTSSSYTRGRSLYSIYSSTKAAVVNLVQALSEEWLPSHIRVNCICPERTLTPMRITNFGLEDPDTLLKPEKVARISIATCFSNLNGEVIDIHHM
jgi:ribitol-5-phosphate 2-dehydrogenase (NADP+) / D-ribitol-5-phosphate cytidylyltransferase